MPELNLFLFLTLALAGVLTIHLYRQDRLEDDDGYGHGQPAGNPPQVIRYRRAGNTVAVRTGIHPIPKDAVCFLDLAAAGPFERKNAQAIRTDFMTAAFDDPEPCEDCMSGQSA
jgi:hypothetical protein